MSGRVYTVDIIPQNLTAYSEDIVELNPASNKPIELMAVNIHQVSDFGDAQDEVLSLKVVRGNTSTGSGGNSVTPFPLRKGDGAASFTAHTFNTSAASSGSPLTGIRHGWNVRAPLERPYIPEERIDCLNGELLVLRLEESPADGLTIAGTVTVREMG